MCMEIHQGVWELLWFVGLSSKTQGSQRRCWEESSVGDMEGEPKNPVWGRRMLKWVRDLGRAPPSAKGLCQYQDSPSDQFCKEQLDYCLWARLTRYLLWNPFSSWVLGFWPNTSFFLNQRVCFPLLCPFHLDWLLKARKKMSFRRFLVADGRSYPVNRAWSHLSIVVPGSAFILHDNTGRGKTVMHHRAVLGCGQRIVFS